MLIVSQLPYGTMTDDEMRQLPMPSLQPDWGILCLWVTGRAMELGRELFQQWGYKRVDELVWIKVSQLGRLIRTGRTGHWLKYVPQFFTSSLHLAPFKIKYPPYPNNQKTGGEYVTDRSFFPVIHANTCS